MLPKNTDLQAGICFGNNLDLKLLRMYWERCEKAQETVETAMGKVAKVEKFLDIFHSQVGLQVTTGDLWPLFQNQWKSSDSFYASFIEKDRSSLQWLITNILMKGEAFGFFFIWFSGLSCWIPNMSSNEKLKL